MRFLRVVNWSKFQHYTDRAPPWIKLQTGLLEKYEYQCLQDASKSHLVGIWMLASRLDNAIPDDPAWIAQRIGATTTVNTQALIDAGFMEYASKPLADCPQVATPEGEGEGEGEAYKDSSTSLVVRDRLDLALAPVREATQRRATTTTTLRLAVDVVFRYWRDRIGKDVERTRLDPKRETRLTARLRENDGDVSELLYAVDGALKDDWLMGRAAKSTRRYDGIEHIFRDREQVERLVELVRNRTEQHPFLASGGG